MKQQDALRQLCKMLGEAAIQTDHAFCPCVCGDPQGSRSGHGRGSGRSDLLDVGLTHQPRVEEDDRARKGEVDMTKAQALSLLREYCEGIKKREDSIFLYPTRNGPALRVAMGMADRFPEDGSKSEAMRWLGYMQGVLVCSTWFTPAAVMQHSKNKTLNPPWGASALPSHSELEDQGNWGVM